MRDIRRTLGLDISYLLSIKKNLANTTVRAKGNRVVMAKKI